MIVEYFLVSLFANGPNGIGSSFVNKFTTTTACEQAAQALRQGNSATGQERQFVCVKYDASK